MSSLALLPPETILLVFQHVDNFHNATRLALVSRHFLGVWRKERGKILYHVGLRTMLAFDYAILSVGCSQFNINNQDSRTISKTVACKR